MTAPPDIAAARPDWTPESLADGGWGLAWKGRRMKTPERRPVTLPTEALARLAAEPAATAVSPAQRLAFTAIDRVSGAREAVAGQIASYAASDVLCYFAEGPQALEAREDALWSPWLAWADAELSVRLERARGVSHTPQSSASIERARALALELDDFSLTGLAAAAALFGSAILAFALQRGALTGEAALDLSRLDEAFQQERWGVDAEAAARTAAQADEARLLDRWLAACKSGPAT